MADFNITLGEFGWDAVAAVSSVFIAMLGIAITVELKRRDKAAERYFILNDYRKEIIAYSAEFFEAVANALALSVDAAAGKTDHLQLKVVSMQLSALADTGRFLYPNDIEGENSYGHEKGPAFAGRRRPPLDAILAAHFAVEAMRNAGEQREMYASMAIRELEKTRLPLELPVEQSSPEYLLIQSRRCYVNAVVPTTFPRERLEMFSSLLRPLNDRR
tara:strand:- start:2809 stop:3459 length:651 start_codon:yes stop_codon:yes gene_type:complete